MDVHASKSPAPTGFIPDLYARLLSPTGTQPSFDAELVEVEQTISNSVQMSFSLIFRAPADTPPAQSLYNVAHPVLGEMLIFLVPIKMNDQGLFFEAVFNKLLLK